MITTLRGLTEVKKFRCDPSTVTLAALVCTLHAAIGSVITLSSSEAFQRCVLMNIQTLSS